MTTDISCLEICAGGGGQLLGLQQARVSHVAAAEIDPDACSTLRVNRPGLKVVEGDIRELDGRQYRGIDLLAGGVPCPPFTVAGKQLGASDERDLFPEALRLIWESQPRAVMLENVKGLREARFDAYRADVKGALNAMGYLTWWRLLNASDYGVPQLRPRMILVALKSPWFDRFRWPLPRGTAPTVGEALGDLMGARLWSGARDWADAADSIAPTIVGGSKKHGGPDLGPTRAREAWKRLGVDGRSIADEAPAPNHEGLVHLTTRMVARLQGFPDSWEFCGRKTGAYRQIGNALPPPVAKAVGETITAALI